jgi:hypothetical protein
VCVVSSVGFDSQQHVLYGGVESLATLVGSAASLLPALFEGPVVGVAYVCVCVCVCVCGCVYLTDHFACVSVRV